MRIVALLAVHNEEAYLANCLRHLIGQGIETCVIDNGSDDASRSIAEAETGVIRIEHLPWGSLDLPLLLREKERLATEIDADWFIRVDADEIMHSYRRGETLREGIERLDAQGLEVINFDEFVFLPLESEYVTDCAGMQPILDYYFYEPQKTRLMRAWKASKKVSGVDGAGHKLIGEEFRLSSETFALRHYIFRNQDHAFEKYPIRKFSEAGLSRGWHANRLNQPRERFGFSQAGELERLSTPASRDLRREKPRLKHYWE
jgi:glycosyltransferase involved in cell wall biosynthesis